MPPLKVEHTGEHVPQKAESSCPAKCHDHFAARMPTLYSHDCFEHIGQDNHKLSARRRLVEVETSPALPLRVRTSSRRIYFGDYMTAPLEAAEKQHFHCDQQGRKQHSRPPPAHSVRREG